MGKLFIHLFYGFKSSLCEYCVYLLFNVLFNVVSNLEHSQAINCHTIIVNLQSTDTIADGSY